jgi:hypothetical protein
MPSAGYGVTVKTTLVLDDDVVVRLRAEAARLGVSMSELAEQAVRRMLDERSASMPALPELPSFSMGEMRVDVSDRQAVYELLDDRGRRPSGGGG